MNTPRSPRISPWALAAILLAPALARAGDTTTQIWTDYHLHYYRSENVEYYGDAGARFLSENSNWLKVYARPTLRFHNFHDFRRVDLHLGIGVFYTYQKNSPDVVEIRPWQGIRLQWPDLGLVTLTNYFRVEERFSSEAGQHDYSAALRLRYRLGTMVPIKRAIHRHEFDPVYMPVSAEVFYDFGDQIDRFFRDEARFSAGLGYVWSNRWVFEFDFTYELSSSGETSDLSTDTCIFRLQVKHLLTGRDYRTTRADIPAE